YEFSANTFKRINNILIAILVIVYIYPHVFVVSASIRYPCAVNTGKMWLWPVDITFEGYKKVFENSEIWRGYRNTIFYTILGTVIHLVILLPAAYALSRKGLRGK